MEKNLEFISADEKPEERARRKIDAQLRSAGWDIVSRNEYVPESVAAVKEAIMQGGKESDYLLFVDNKAIAVVEAKREEIDVASKDAVRSQVEYYAHHPKTWYGCWKEGFIPLVYVANGKKLLFRNLLNKDSKYKELGKMHSAKDMLKLIGETSAYGALPTLDKEGLRECQYDAELAIEKSFKDGRKKALNILATGSGKTYLACLLSYRLLNYTPNTKRVLFLVDRNNLARQTLQAYSKFDLTEDCKKFSDLYSVGRLRRPEDVNNTVVISTIQKLYAVLTGQNIIEIGEDEEDEKIQESLEHNTNEVVTLGSDLKLPPDYFQLIVVDECHRSIYGKWQAVLKYFRDAHIVGLTATSTEEAEQFFEHNIVINYTYEQSVLDGVNVPQRVYRITTYRTENGGIIVKDTQVAEESKRTGEQTIVKATQDISYKPEELDRIIRNPEQINFVLKMYRDSIFTDMYPERDEDWRYIPKTLIFAKDDAHATAILQEVQKVFAEKFPEGKLPENFAKKITYTAGDSNALIRDFNYSKEFRIAITVTLVATGTDVQPLEVVLFMNDVRSDLLYTQMKGRGCRTISDDRFQEQTPNAQTKEFFYIVDAVGVTKSDKILPTPKRKTEGKDLNLTNLLEHLAHGDLSDENLILLRDYLATLQRRYEINVMLSHHLTEFIDRFGFAPRTLAYNINEALKSNTLPPFESASEPNRERMELVKILIGNVDAREEILTMQRGYIINAPQEDKLIFKGHDTEAAKAFIQEFEKYIFDNKDKVEALKIIYYSKNTLITHTMLQDLQDKLLAFNRQYTPHNIWWNYRELYTDSRVERLDMKQSVTALTHLIQIVRFAFGKNEHLTSLLKGYGKQFSLYCGQKQRNLTPEQVEVMRSIAEYIAGEGGITAQELNQIDADLWRTAVKSMGNNIKILDAEITDLAKFLLKVA